MYLFHLTKVKFAFFSWFGISLKEIMLLLCVSRVSWEMKDHQDPTFNQFPNTLPAQNCAATLFLQKHDNIICKLDFVKFGRYTYWCDVQEIWFFDTILHISVCSGSFTISYEMKRKKNAFYFDRRLTNSWNTCCTSIYKCANIVYVVFLSFSFCYKTHGTNEL